MPFRRVAPLLLLPWLLLPACRPDATPARDVLLITVDTLRPDHLGLYGYGRASSPQLDRWFADAALFERAYSTSASTSPSVVSLLSGRLPQEHGVRLFFQLVNDDYELLPELLPSSYQTAAFVSNFVLTDEAIGLARAFDHYDDFVAERESSREIYHRSARGTTDAALAWLARRSDAERPLFLWLHYIDPHGPYDPPGDWERSFTHAQALPISPQRVRPHLRLRGVEDGLEYVDRYDEEIAYADAHIGRLLEGYAKQRDLAQTLVIFTADHGESMMDHEGWFRHGYQVYEEIVRVPLAIRGPGVVPGRQTAPVSGIDLLPTLLAFAGVSPPAGGAGIDLLSGSLPPDRTLFAEALEPPTQWRAAIRGSRKWLVELRHGERTILERRLYDLAADPEEARPKVWPQGDPTGDRLLELCRSDPDPGGRPTRYRAGVYTAAPKVAPRADSEDLHRLRALGYVE